MTFANGNETNPEMNEVANQDTTDSRAIAVDLVQFVTHRVVVEFIGTLRIDNEVVWKTLRPRVGLGRAPRTKRGKYVVKIKNAIIRLLVIVWKTVKRFSPFPTKMTQNSFKPYRKLCSLV